MPYKKRYRISGVGMFLLMLILALSSGSFGVTNEGHEVSPPSIFFEMMPIKLNRFHAHREGIMIQLCIYSPSNWRDFYRKINEITKVIGIYCAIHANIHYNS